MQQVMKKSFDIYCLDCGKRFMFLLKLYAAWRSHYQIELHYLSTRKPQYLKLMEILQLRLTLQERSKRKVTTRRICNVTTVSDMAIRRISASSIRVVPTIDHVIITTEIIQTIRMSNQKIILKHLYLKRYHHARINLIIQSLNRILTQAQLQICPTLLIYSISPLHHQHRNQQLK